MNLVVETLQCNVSTWVFIEAMQRVLVNPEMGGFSAEDMTVLKNLSRQVMEDAIYSLNANRHYTT